MIDRLAGIPLFADLAESDLRDLASHAITRSFPKNSIILNEGDQAGSLYIILSGRVQIFVSDDDGKEAILSIEGPGEYFGEMMLDDGPRSASVIALEPCKLCVLEGQAFKAFLLKKPEIALHLIQNLIKRTRVLTKSVKSLALLDVYGRVARLLLDMAEEQDGRLVIGERLTQQDIASRVGASREMISRILKDLVTGGYISIEGKNIFLNKQPPKHW
ncbi:MAG: Crp/Fnr family transcriptional regulator [Pseudomonadota bacterium]